MKTLLAILVVLALALAGVWLALQGDAAAPPPAAGPAAPAGATAPDRDSANLPTRAATGQQAPAPAASQAAPAAPPSPAEAPIRLELLAYDAATLQGLASFRCRWRGDGRSGFVDGRDGRAVLRGDLPQTVELLVEAERYEPFPIAAATLAAADAPPTRVEAFLLASAAHTGIVLTLRTLAQEPLGHMQFSVHPLTDPADDTPFELRPALWTRKSQQANGRYALPDLPTGRYGLRAIALDEQGQPLPLLPHRGEYTLTGSNGYDEEVTLEPGCLLRLEMVDAQGALVDPATAPLTLSLRLPGGPEQPRAFLGRSADGKLLRARDALPAAGPTWLEAALPAGQWQLEWQRGEQAPQSQLLVLRAGETMTERCVVR
jgi:hypothetical protein